MPETASSHGRAAPIHGWVAPGFEAVRAEFRRNFAERGEVGAACAAYHQGEVVVDLWGGYRHARRKEPWQQDTLMIVFSATVKLSLDNFQALSAKNEHRVRGISGQSQGAGGHDAGSGPLAGLAGL